MNSRWIRRGRVRRLPRRTLTPRPSPQRSASAAANTGSVPVDFPVAKPNPSESFTLSRSTAAKARAFERFASRRRRSTSRSVDDDGSVATFVSFSFPEAFSNPARVLIAGFAGDSEGTGPNPPGVHACGVGGCGVIGPPYHHVDSSGASASRYGRRRPGVAPGVRVRIVRILSARAIGFRGASSRVGREWKRVVYLREVFVEFERRDGVREVIDDDSRADSSGVAPAAGRGRGVDVHRLSNVEARDVHARGGDASTRPSVRELEDDGDGVAAVAGETRGFGFDWEGERGVSSRDEADPGALGFLHALVAPPTRGDADPGRSAAEVPSRWWRMSSTEPLAPSAPPLARAGGDPCPSRGSRPWTMWTRRAARGRSAVRGGGASAPRADAHRQTVGGSLEDGTRGWGREGGSARGEGAAPRLRRGF